ncbi:uncharacterized protein OCT59_017333 [Rhizophagus irregularis]|uniref:uncharacterized protein n=1 Tax=Rhizophagus irregularis TaxID=588596 RepID=UPI003332F031|nr:hypothetical protein OCT59_017333 [Rhizophagus irregularis]
MISEFLTEVDGRLKLKPENIEQYPNVPVEAREYLEQIKIKAIPIFEVLYPNCIGIFAFDNSSNHAIFAKDALVAKKMNLKPGERKKWPNGGLMLECKECKEKNDDENRINCCARRVMSLEPDFLAQKGAIAEIIEKAGHKCIFYPKFHCELNFIERYWGLQRGMQEKTVIIHGRFARKAWRYMSLYQKGIGGKLAEYAVKKYRSRRRIPDEVIEELNQIKFD